MMRKQLAMKPRSGVSLLEVLISIGVLAIGLLGVMALIPAAASLAETGARNDAIAISGRRILREFNVRGYNLVTNLQASPPATVSVVVDNNGIILNPRRAFCFDPIGYALGNANNNTIPEVYSFPSYNSINDDGPVFMPRLSNSSTGLPGELGENFYFEDDLEFELPQTANQDPQQIPLRYADPTDTSVRLATKRYAKGQFSWFATLVPKSKSAPGVRYPSYELSIAVVRNRNTLQPSSADVTQVQIFDGSGTIAINTDNGPLDVKDGNWFMLMNGPNGQVVGTTPNVPHQFEWYQVVSNNGGTIEVNGPNWIVNGTTPIYNTIAVVVPEVVAVYSKTINLRE